MILSLQASGGRLSAPANPAFPFRVVIFEEDSDGWSISSVFEMATYEEAEEEALEICTEPYLPGVIAMHFIIGEVANG